ncbi:hypothetical protein NKH82_25255 [Mesorhizobium sp. M0915]|nr:hypothetical protein [Mesorhizobium sp. LSHC420B00]
MHSPLGARGMNLGI